MFMGAWYSYHSPLKIDDDGSLTNHTLGGVFPLTQRFTGPLNCDLTMSITLNSKVFETTSRPGPSSAILTTVSRGETLPDTILIDNRVKKNPQETGSLNRVRKISIRRSYAASDLIKYGDISLVLDTPDDMDSTNVDALIADLTDYLASAITLRATNVSSLKLGVIS